MNDNIFPIGEPNDAYAEFFSGQSYLKMLSDKQVPIFNVTFEPGCRNNWHIHHAESGGGQILIVVSGRGYYQEWGKPAQELHPGDVVNIPAKLSIGTERQKTVGFRILHWKFLLSEVKTNGVNL